MSAIVVILPPVRAENKDAAPSVVVTLKHRDFARLPNRANEWGVTTAEAASMELARALQPPKRAQMTDLSTITRIYQGSNGEATKMLYRDLEAFGPMGKIAVNLFRASKCSERAKLYRKGPGYKSEAYARKDWSIKNFCEALLAQQDNHRLIWGWAVDEALKYRADPHHHILYVELPTGQVSFHVGQRYDGPDFAGQWDGVRDVQAERICRFVAEVFKMEMAR